jgi:formylglycine-generating enzyme required for sulfatase activity
MGTEPWFGEEHVKEGPGYPAVCVTWHEAQELAFRLGRHAGEPGFRLPTEAEWEYACRAGTDTLWCFGDEDAELDEHAWYDLNTGPARQRHARPVGQKLRNPWGLHDMHGNVAEWCQDWYQEEGKDQADYVGYYGHAPEVDPMGPAAGTGRVVRGGSWRTGFLGTHSASRTCAAPQERGPDIGVRLVRSAGGRR